MTDLLTTDSADSGEVVRLHDAIVDTDVLDLGEHTRNLSAFARSLPPMRGLRRPDATGEYPVYRPQTIAVIDGEQPTEPIPPTVYRSEPDNYQGTHRRPRPLWAWRALLVGLGSVGTVAIELAGIGALAVLR